MLALADVIKTLQAEIETLQEDAEKEKSAALIESYFQVNDKKITISADTNFTMVIPFCVEGPSVFEFDLAASFDLNVENIMVDLMIDGESVAQSEITDNETPSNVSLIYRGRIDENSEVIFAMMADKDTEIAAKHLQYGYKLYGPGYNLIGSPDMSCI